MCLCDRVLSSAMICSYTYLGLDPRELLTNGIPHHAFAFVIVCTFHLSAILSFWLKMILQLTFKR